MRKLILVLLVLVSFSGFSQKVKEKDGIVLVDKVEYIKLKEDKVSKRCYTISNLKGEEILYIRAASYIDPSKIEPNRYGSGYSSGEVWYFEILSADLNTIYFENRFSGSPFNSFYVENIISNLYNGEAINPDGSLNIDKFNMLSKKIGFEFSKKRDAINNRPSNNTQTIIIKEETPRNGININLGR